jgi:hypothetical protein
MALQVGLQGARQHDDTVLAALAVADGELVPLEVEVVNAELAALLPPQPGAGEQAGHEPEKAAASLDGIEEATDLLWREHQGQQFGRLARRASRRGSSTPRTC